MKEEFDPDYFFDPIVPRGGGVGIDWKDESMQSQSLEAADDSIIQHETDEKNGTNGYFSPNIPLCFDFDGNTEEDLRLDKRFSEISKERLLIRRASKYVELPSSEFDEYTLLVCALTDNFLGLGAQFAKSNIKQAFERIWHEEGSFDDVELVSADNGQLKIKIAISTSRVGYITTQTAEIIPVVMTLTTMVMLAIDNQDDIKALRKFDIEHSKNYKFKQPLTRNKISKRLISPVSMALNHGETAFGDMSLELKSMVDAEEVEISKTHYSPGSDPSQICELMLGPYKKYAKADINSSEILRITETEKVLPIVAKNYEEVLVEFDSMLTGLKKLYPEWISSQPISESERRQIEASARAWKDEYKAQFQPTEDLPAEPKKQKPSSRHSKKNRVPKKNRFESAQYRDYINEIVLNWLDEDNNNR